MPFITKDKTNWKFLIIIVILAAVVGGGILWCSTKQELTYQPPEIQGPAKVDETTDWQTYRNEEYGFEVKYPAEWEEGMTGCIDYLKSCDGSYYEFGIGEGDTLGTFDKGIRIVISPFKEYHDLKDLDDKWTTFMSKEEKDSGEIWYYEHDNGVTKFAFFVKLMFYGGKTFRIEPIFGNLETKFNEEEFNQILSTFRFIGRYGISGESKWETMVSGYLETKVEEIIETDSTITVPYFVITKFYDEQLRESMEEKISNGNTVNIKEDGIYKFNLGCLEDGKIVGIEYDNDETYMDEETMQRILSSSKENTVTIVLSFGRHLGMGCICCNLAHKVRIYEE